MWAAPGAARSPLARRPLPHSTSRAAKMAAAVRAIGSLGRFAAAAKYCPPRRPAAEGEPRAGGAVCERESLGWGGWGVVKWRVVGSGWRGGLVRGFVRGLWGGVSTREGVSGGVYEG